MLLDAFYKPLTQVVCFMPKPKSSRTGKVAIRFAGEKDAAALCAMFRELAEYERMLDRFEATEQKLRDSLFRKRAAEALIAEREGTPVGYAVFFSNFSAFRGKAGIFVEDIYVKPEMRRKGLGRKLFAFIAKVAAEWGCERLDWLCLDWNEPAKSFYRNWARSHWRNWLCLSY